MIGPDANVLLRWLIRSDAAEDPDRAGRAAAAVRSGPFRIAQVVRVETVWTLRGRCGLDRPAIAAILRRISDVPQGVVERADAVARATDAYEAGGAGFADHLPSIVTAVDGCSTTRTFDKSAARGDPFPPID